MAQKIKIGKLGPAKSKLPENLYNITFKFRDKPGIEWEVTTDCVSFHIGYPDIGVPDCPPHYNNIYIFTPPRTKNYRECTEVHSGNDLGEGIVIKISYYVGSTYDPHDFANRRKEEYPEPFPEGTELFTEGYKINAILIKEDGYDSRSYVAHDMSYIKINKVYRKAQKGRRRPLVQWRFD